MAHVPAPDTTGHNLIDAGPNFPLKSQGERHRTSCGADPIEIIRRATNYIKYYFEHHYSY